MPGEMQQSCWFVTSDIAEARDRLAQQVDAGITIHRIDVNAINPAEQEQTLAALGAQPPLGPTMASNVPSAAVERPRRCAQAHRRPA
ncbi:MAG: hypothetical protein F4X26_03455 [Chloroflexi bacterium]|nr:hypothetical protein [Chloroflexota bacterium]